MKRPILNRLLQKHVTPIVAEEITKQSPDVVARMTRRGLVWDSRKHRWVKPASSNAPKTDWNKRRWDSDPDIDNEAEEYAREQEEWNEQHSKERELDRLQEEWDKVSVRRGDPDSQRGDVGHDTRRKKDTDKSSRGIKKQSPDVAARMWQRGLVWDGNKHRWVKRPQITHEDAPTEGKSYHDNVIVIPKDKSFWGSGATYGETEKASKVLASMLEHKFPGSTVMFGKKPAIQGEHQIEIDKWIAANWKKAVSRRKGNRGAFDKSNSEASSRIAGASHYSDKEKEQRKKDAKFWEEKNREYLKNHPDRRGGR